MLPCLLTRHNVVSSSPQTSLLPRTYFCGAHAPGRPVADCAACCAGSVWAAGRAAGCGRRRPRTPLRAPPGRPPPWRPSRRPLTRPARAAPSRPPRVAAVLHRRPDHQLGGLLCGIPCGGPAAAALTELPRVPVGPPPAHLRAVVRPAPLCGGARALCSLLRFPLAVAWRCSRSVRPHALLQRLAPQCMFGRHLGRSQVTSSAIEMMLQGCEDLALAYPARQH